MLESNDHAMLRKRLIQVLMNNGYDKNNIKESHAKGDISLLLEPRKKNKRSVHFTDADIVVIVEGRIKYIVEIETSSASPKKIIGDIVATSASKFCSTPKGDADRNIKEISSNAVLFIILQSELVQSEGKGQQILNIEKRLRTLLARPSIKFKICTEKNFENRFKKINSRYRFL